MQLSPENTITSIEPAINGRLKTLDEYNELLDSHGLAYKKVDYYLQVGDIRQVQGWILHITIVRSQIKEVFERILPTLLESNIPFKIIQNKSVAGSLLDGSLGHAVVGKVMSIYTPENVNIVSLARELASLTTSFKGPTILTDIHLGGLVYTRYGSFDPVIMNDVSGKEERFIYDQKGELVRDIYKIPFQMPEGVKWPFEGIADPICPPIKQILHGIYKPVTTLKSDAKGNVLKALYLRKPFFLGWCVIKEGKKDMWSDESGRDIPDRLAWQKELHESVQDVVPMPKILDFFVENEDTYLVMEYIRGRSFLDTIRELNKNCETWESIPVKDRVVILDYILQMISIISRLHKKGYVHRDITPVNFLIKRDEKLVLIDNELSYSLIIKKPSPPFEAGTNGFMSPEQVAVSTPTFKEDIYGLGATIIVAITSLSPIAFDASDLLGLKNSLSFFIDDEKVTEMITGCLDSDPKKRPAIESILNTFKNYRAKINQTSSSPDRHFKTKRRYKIEDVITGGIAGLVNEPTLIVNDLWQSRTKSKDEISGKQINEFGKSGGLYEGITGLLYFIARAKKCGYDISPCQKAYEKGWDYIGCNYLEALPNITPGLYGGAAGIALALKEGIEGRLLENNIENKSYLSRCLNIAPVGLDLASGVTGQAISAMQCRDHLGNEDLEHLLQGCLTLLLGPRQKIGYWIMAQDQAGRKSSASSFSNGNTGIVWFLLHYCERYNDEAVIRMAIQGLDACKKLFLLFKKMFKKYGYSVICNDPRTRSGLPGLILIFIKAYKSFNDGIFMEMAEYLLSQYPANIVHENYSQATGISGLGELYLEAYKAFGSIEWRRRADWISDLFLNTCRKGPTPNTYYWLTGNYSFPTADFMVGNSGIIHFLIRYLDTDEIGYRILL